MYILLCWLIPVIFSMIKYLNYTQINGAYNIDLYVGNPRSFHYFEIDLQSPFTLMHTNSLIKEHSTSFTSFGNIGMEKELIEDEIVLNADKEISINKFFFYYTNKPKQENDYVSFSYSLLDKRLSIVHQLKEKGEISELKFGLLPQERNTGRIFLGGFPETIKENYHSLTYHVEEKWGTQINSVKIGNLIKYKGNNEYGLLQGNLNAILVPKKVMILLNKHYFNDFFNKGKCAYESDSINCECSIMGTLPTIVFELGKKEKMLVEFKSEELFLPIGINCRFLIEENTKEENQFVFGIPFLKRYPMQFDYDNHSFTIYSKTMFTFNKIEFLFKILLITLINCILGLSSFILFLLFSKIKKQNKRKTLLLTNMNYAFIHH